MQDVSKSIFIQTITFVQGSASASVNQISESKKIMTMKKTAHLTIAFALCFSNVLNLEAANIELTQTSVNTLTESSINSWEKPKAAESLMNRIDLKINALQKEKGQQQTNLDEPNVHLSDKQKDKITSSIKDLNSRLVELNTSKEDIDRLANDKNHIYAFSKTGENSVIRKTENVIVIQGANDALLIHEIRHISLWLQSGRNFQFSINKLLMPLFADGSVDELQSYRAQYAFAPNSLPGVFPIDMAHVNIEYIAKIQKADGSIAYPSIRKMWQDDLRISKQKTQLNQSTQGIYSSNDKH